MGIALHFQLRIQYFKLNKDKSFHLQNYAQPLDQIKRKTWQFKSSFSHLPFPWLCHWPYPWLTSRNAHLLDLQMVKSSVSLEKYEENTTYVHFRSRPSIFDPSFWCTSLWEEIFLHSVGTSQKVLDLECICCSNKPDQNILQLCFELQPFFEKPYCRLWRGISQADCHTI